MSTIQTIEEKQLAAEVYAQRLAYISVTGKEPDALDTITPSGYLNCWNEVIATVGNPFTDSGQALLGKLQQKATFHGQKKLYHKDFSAFFFRVIYIHFIEDKPFSELPAWQDLDFGFELPCPASGVENWLEASLGEQLYSKQDSNYLVEIIDNHKDSGSSLLCACITWAKASCNTLKTRVEYREGMQIFRVRCGKEYDLNPNIELSEKILIDRKSHVPVTYNQTKNLLQEQAVAHLAVEREIYYKLFFTEPGEWCVENYINNQSKQLNNHLGYSDLIAVKLAEGIRLEAGFARLSILPGEIVAPADGWHYDEDGGDAHIALDYGYNEVLMPLQSDIYDIEEESIINHIYHYNFLPCFLYKLGVEQTFGVQHISKCVNSYIRWNWFEAREIKAGTPARLEYTAHWIEFTYRYLTREDWQYLASLLNSILDIKIESKEWALNKETGERQEIIITGKLSEKYPAVQRAVDYAKFRVSTVKPEAQYPLPAPTMLKQSTTPTIENKSIIGVVPQPAALGITWQGPRTEFVELACALYEAGSLIVNGSGGRDVAVERLGNALGVSGKTPISVVLQDIKNKRNGDRQTPLLDRLKSKFLDYLSK